MVYKLGFKEEKKDEKWNKSTKEHKRICRR